MLFTLLFACVDSTYDVPTTYTLPTENTAPQNDPPPPAPNLQGEEAPPSDPNSQSAEPPPEDRPHKDMPPGAPGGNPPQDGEIPPPPPEDVANSGDEPPPPPGSIISNAPGEPNDAPPQPPVTPGEPGENAPSYEDGCIISHQWKDLRAEDIEKVSFTAELDHKGSIEMLIVDIVSFETKEVQVGLICPSNQISVNIPKNLGEVQLAIFVDNNQNGPSADDAQTTSQPFTVAGNSVSLDKIALSNTPIEFYNFKED